MSIMSLLRNGASAWMTSKCHSFSHSPIYILLLRRVRAWRWRARTRWGESDLFSKITRFTQVEFMFDVLTILGSAAITHPLLTPLLSTGQLGQHQHHPAVLPWSPPAVRGGVAPGGRAGGPAGVQSSRCVGIDDTRGRLNAEHCHLRHLKTLFLVVVSWWHVRFLGVHGFAVEEHKNNQRLAFTSSPF